MKPGGGASKGYGFEREVCVDLSLWVSRGQNKDLFWRTAMSGGRSTVHKKSGGKIRQSGDICAVAPEGHPLTDKFFIECKRVKKLGIDAFLFKLSGLLADFWYTASHEAESYGKQPMIIAREDRFPALIITPKGVQHFPRLIVTGPSGYEIGMFEIFLASSPSRLIPDMAPLTRAKLPDEETDTSGSL